MATTTHSSLRSLLTLRVLPRSWEWTLRRLSPSGGRGPKSRSRRKPGKLTEIRVPPNCRFELDDMERDFHWQENSFDFIFARDLILAVRNWERLIDQVYT